MSDGVGPTLDLQSILATLAQHAAPAQNPPGNHVSITDEQTKPTPPPQAKAEDPRIRPQCRPTASPKPNIDPASITTWQDGIRCVTKIAAQNAQFAVSIRRLMDNQKKHEMRWYAERQALWQGHGERERAAAQAQQILKGLSNGSATNAASSANVTDLDAELATFDRKIYAAQAEMETSMTSELKGLGVPFFGTDQSAVVEGKNAEEMAQLSSSRLKHSPMVTESQLLELRRRIVGHLELLYRE